MKSKSAQGGAYPKKNQPRYPKVARLILVA